MSASIILQSLIIFACVLASAAYVLRNVTPALSGWLRQRMADALQRSGHAALAARIRPAQASAAKGCGSGCGTCGSCDTPTQPAPRSAPLHEQPLTFHPRR